MSNTGKCKFFNAAKGYGFITEVETNQDYFFHVSNVSETVEKDDRVQFDLEQGKRGVNAINVKKLVV